MKFVTLTIIVLNIIWANSSLFFAILHLHFSQYRRSLCCNKRSVNYCNGLLVEVNIPGEKSTKRYSGWKVNKKIFHVKSQQKSISCEKSTKRYLNFEKSTKRHSMWKSKKRYSRWKVNKKKFQVKSKQKEIPGKKSTKRDCRWKVNKKHSRWKVKKCIPCEK